MADNTVQRALGLLRRAGSGYRPPAGKPANVKIPGYGEVEARPIPDLHAAGRKIEKNYGRHTTEGFAPLNEDFSRKVADVFDKAHDAPHDPHVKRAYDALIDETLHQYKAAREAGYEFSFLKPGEKDPYALSPGLGYVDLVNRRKLRVFPTDQGYGQGDHKANPLLKRVGKIGDLPNATANDAFRIVHDVFGHFAPGNPFFRAPGEERAYQLHSRMYGPEARKAAATETRGQNSWVNYGPHGAANKTASGANTIYAPQKAILMPDWATEEKPPGFKRGGAPEPGSVEPDEAQDPNREAPSIGSLINRGQPLHPMTARPTPEQVRAARADDRVGSDIVNKRLGVIVPEHTRVAGGTYTPGAPGGGRWADATIAKQHMRLRSGAAKYVDPFALRDEGDYEPHTTHEKLVDQPGRGFKVKDQELHNLWQHSVNESSKAAQNAVAKHGVQPTFSGEDWNQAMSLPLRDHLWYELSGEKMAENLPDLTPKEHMRMLDILGATSARAKPDENLERTLGVLSQHMRGAPADVDLTTPGTVTQALGRKGADTSALPGNKTGHFSDTLALAGGVPTRFPISVNDVWVGKMFGVPDDVMSSNQSLHEPMAHYFNKLRDLYNERHGHELPMKYQSWNFQAPAWVHLRNQQSGAPQGDAYHQVWGKTLQKLKDANIPGVEGEKITRKALMHPGFADALRRQAKGFRDAPKATAEFGTTQTSVGKRAHQLYQQALEKGDKLSQHEYTKGLTTAMYASARGKDHPWDRLKKAITGDVTGKSDITRIMAPTSESPLDVGGTFEGALSPNIRVPLKDMDDRHLAEFNAITGRHLKQDAMAVSHVLGAEHGSAPREGYTRGHSLFVPTTNQMQPDDIRAFAKELAPHGHNMSYVRHPNGYQFDVLPAFSDEGLKGPNKHLLDKAYGKTLRHTYGPANVTAHDFKSVYTPAADYGKVRAALTKRMRDEYVQQAGQHGLSRAQALKALEAPEGDLPRGGKEARDVYRQRVAHLAGAEQGFKELAQRVGEAHKGFIERATKRLARPAPPRDPDAPPFASGGAVNHDPTDAQKAAGNYAKEHVSFQGLPISIENKKGSVRSGVDGKGKRWSARLPADYGYVRETNGADGDHVDCFIGPHRASPLVVVIDQHDHRSNRFDEHKCMLGYRTERSALDDYQSAFSDGRGADRIGHVQAMSVDAFKKWLKSGRTTKAAASQSIVDHALQLARSGRRV